MVSDSRAPSSSWKGASPSPFAPGGSGQAGKNAILEFELEPAGRGARLRIRDTAFGRIDSGPRDGTRDGWLAILGALRTYVER